jgi:hypothetical protein
LICNKYLVLPLLRFWPIWTTVEFYFNILRIKHMHLQWGHRKKAHGLWGRICSRVYTFKLSKPQSQVSPKLSNAINTKCANKSDFVKIFIKFHSREQISNKSLWLFFLLAFGEYIKQAKKRKWYSNLIKQLRCLTKNTLIWMVENIVYIIWVFGINTPHTQTQRPDTIEWSIA